MENREIPTGVKVISIFYFFSAVWVFLRVSLFSHIQLTASDILGQATNFLTTILLPIIGFGWPWVLREEFSGSAGTILTGFFIGGILFLIGRELWKGERHSNWIIMVNAFIGTIGGILFSGALKNTYTLTKIFAGIFVVILGGFIIIYLGFNKKAKEHFKKESTSQSH